MGYNLPINGVYWGYNPLTNLLLTSWDIQVRLILLDPVKSVDSVWPAAGHTEQSLHSSFFLTVTINFYGPKSGKVHQMLEKTLSFFHPKAPKSSWRTTNSPKFIIFCQAFQATIICGDKSWSLNATGPPWWRQKPWMEKKNTGSLGDNVGISFWIFIPYQLNSQR